LIESALQTEKIVTSLEENKINFKMLSKIHLIVPVFAVDVW